MGTYTQIGTYRGKSYGNDIRNSTKKRFPLKDIIYCSIIRLDRLYFVENMHRFVNDFVITFTSGFYVRWYNSFILIILRWVCVC